MSDKMNPADVNSEVPIDTTGPGNVALAPADANAALTAAVAGAGAGIVPPIDDAPLAGTGAGGTDSTLGYGSQIYYSSDGTTWHKILQTIDLSGPEPEVGDVKVTNNDSPSNTHEYRPGMIEPGEQELDSIFTAAQMVALNAMLGDGNIYEFAEVYTDDGPSGWHYSGYLKKIGIETKTEDDANHAKITIKLTSRPVFVPIITVSGSSGSFTMTFANS